MAETEKKMDSIRVNGQDYTFTLSSGSNLTISGLTVTGTLTADTITASTANLSVINLTFSSSIPGSSIPSRKVTIDTNKIYTSEDYEIQASQMCLAADTIKLQSFSDTSHTTIDFSSDSSYNTIISCDTGLEIYSTYSSGTICLCAPGKIILDGENIIMSGTNISSTISYVETKDLIPIRTGSSANADFGSTSK